MNAAVMFDKRFSLVPEHYNTTLVSGWHTAPDERGTISILIASFSTIFFCTWTALCLNIPHPRDGAWKTTLRKAKWMGWATLAPELVVTIAMGQLGSAHRSVKKFRSLGHNGWTVMHAFFADMGGFVLRTDDYGEFVVNAKQMAYLVEHNYIDYPNVSPDDIEDKSKATWFSKTIALSQIIWTVVTLIARRAQNLPVTLLELFTASIIFCTFGTYFCWLHKPKDIARGIVIPALVPVMEMRRAAHAHGKSWVGTPLDFIGEDVPIEHLEGSLSLRPSYSPCEQPLLRARNDWYPAATGMEGFIVTLITHTYASLHWFGASFNFPKKWDCNVYMTGCAAVAVYGMAFWALKWVENIATRRQRKEAKEAKEAKPILKRPAHKKHDSVMSTGKTPQLETDEVPTPLTPQDLSAMAEKQLATYGEISVLSPSEQGILGIDPPMVLPGERIPVKLNRYSWIGRMLRMGLFIPGKILIIFEMFATLRRVPAGTFQTPAFAQFFPSVH